MKIVTLFNEKGGVGKTSLSNHLAAGLAIRGHNVVLVDSDPQGHATIANGLPKEPCFYDLLIRNARWQDVLRLIPAEQYTLPDEVGAVNGKLMVVPGNVESRSIAESLGDVFAVMTRLRQLEGAVDYVVIDTSPTPNLLHAAIHMATDIIIHPTQLTAFSFDGLRESISHLANYNPYREARNLPPIYTAGIVPTMVKVKTVEHSENLERLRKAFGDQVWDPIPARTIWDEATGLKKPIFRIAPNSAAAREAWNFVDQAERAFAHVGS